MLYVKCLYYLFVQLQQSKNHTANCLHRFFPRIFTFMITRCNSPILVLQSMTDYCELYSLLKDSWVIKKILNLIHLGQNIYID